MTDADQRHELGLHVYYTDGTEAVFTIPYDEWSESWLTDQIAKGTTPQPWRVDVRGLPRGVVYTQTAPWLIPAPVPRLTPLGRMLVGLMDDIDDKELLR